MIFDSDEQRKAVFANLRNYGAFRYRRSYENRLKRLDWQIKNLRKQRGDFQRAIDTGHEPRYVLELKLAELDSKIEKLESEKRCLEP